MYFVSNSVFPKNNTFVFVPKLFPYRENHNLLVNGLHQLAKTANHILHPQPTTCPCSCLVKYQASTNANGQLRHSEVHLLQLPLRIPPRQRIRTVPSVPRHNLSRSILRTCLFCSLLLPLPHSPHSLWYQLCYS